MIMNSEGDRKQIRSNYHKIYKDFEYLHKVHQYET